MYRRLSLVTALILLVSTLGATAGEIGPAQEPLKAMPWLELLLLDKLKQQKPVVVPNVVGLVVVPNVVGLVHQFSAVAALSAAGLKTGTVTLARSETVNAGIVISQNPVAGTSVPVGSPVALLVSIGQRSQN